MNDYSGSNENETCSDILITKKNTIDYLKQAGLKKSLTTEYLWGITVGLAISGLFFGWNTALKYISPIDLILLIVFLSIFYSLYVCVLAKLAVSLPYAGAGYAYARKALGKFWGFTAGTAKIIQLLCMAAVILSYLSLYIKTNYPVWPDFIVLIILVALILIQNTGVKQTAMFQFVITCINVSIFMLFVMGIRATDSFQMQTDIFLPEGLTGLFAAIPFALWFFLGVDITSLTAEETKNAADNIPRVFIGSLATVFLLLLGTLWISINSVSWQVLARGNFPLISILDNLQQGDQVLLAVFTFLSLSGFIAGINGVLIGYSRQLFSLGRAGYLPQYLGKISEKAKVPYIAILSSFFVLLLAEFVKTIILIKVACIFALISYLLVLISYLKIVGKDQQAKAVIPEPVLYIAVLVCFCLLAGILFSEVVTVLIVSVLFALLGVYYLVVARHHINHDAPEEIEANTDDINIIITYLKKGE